MNYGLIVRMYVYRTPLIKLTLMTVAAVLYLRKLFIYKVIIRHPILPIPRLQYKSNINLIACTSSTYLIEFYL